MLTRYSDMIHRLCRCEHNRLSVAVAHDRGLVHSIAEAHRIAGIKSILHGRASEIERLLDETGYDGPRRVVDEPDEGLAARAAVRAVRDGEAQVLMKGLVNTSDFLRAVLDREIGLRTERLLSHLAAFEVPGFRRFLFVTDGGINIAPDLEEKKGILANALEALVAMGYDCPKVAVLAANERVSPKAPATVDADEIVRAWRAGYFRVNCLVEGPMALDVALSREAAEHKRIESRIAGEADLFLVSGIEVGNVLGKSMAHIAGAQMSGVVLGARAPIVLTSRAESAKSKLNSILLASGCSS